MSLVPRDAFDVIDTDEALDELTPGDVIVQQIVEKCAPVMARVKLAERAQLQGKALGVAAAQTLAQDEKIVEAGSKLLGEVQAEYPEQPTDLDDLGLTIKRQRHRRYVVERQQAVRKLGGAGLLLTPHLEGEIERLDAEIATSTMQIRKRERELLAELGE